MKMNLLKSALICIILVQASCVGVAEPNLYRPKVEAGTPGLIGDFKFYTEPDSRIQLLYDSTSALAVYDDTSGKVINLGTALYVKNREDNLYYLITAAHNVFDFSKGKLRGLRISIGYIEDEYSYDYFNLEHMKSKYLLYNRANDFIAMPVDKAKSRPAFLVNFSNPFPNNFPNIELENNRLVSVSVKSTRDERGFVKFHQTNFSLLPSEQFQRQMKSSLDAVKGMSGSPLFYFGDSDTYLLGVVTSTNKYKNCVEFTISKCFNLVTLTKTQ